MSDSCASLGVLRWPVSINIITFSSTTPTYGSKGKTTKDRNLKGQKLERLGNGSLFQSESWEASFPSDQERRPTRESLLVRFKTSSQRYGVAGSQRNFFAVDVFDRAGGVEHGREKKST